VNGEETTAKKAITFRGDDKKGSQIFKKYRVTPSVAAPNDTNPSDATDCSDMMFSLLGFGISAMRIRRHNIFR